jgi:hypothetical protein
VNVELDASICTIEEEGVPSANPSNASSGDAEIVELGSRIRKRPGHFDAEDGHIGRDGVVHDKPERRGSGAVDVQRTGDEKLLTGTSGEVYPARGQIDISALYGGNSLRAGIVKRLLYSFLGKAVDNAVNIETVIELGDGGCPLQTRLGNCRRAKQ